MRKLLTIFLAFSLLITVFTVNTFADEEGGTNNNEDPIFNIVQSETGDIKISLKADQPNDGYNLEDINSVLFDCWENGMQYYYTFDTNSLIFLNDEVIIYYEDVEPSNLKAGKNYDVCIYFDDGTNYTLEQKFCLTTGSKRKDIPNYTASQNEEGDIILSFENSDFPKLVNRITIQNHEITKYVYVSVENFRLSDDGKDIIIPASYVKKTQLITGEYDIHLEYENQNSDTSEYFECQPNVKIDISVGGELPELPEYSINQKDNGDIVISSENSELISLINDIWYYPLSNQRAGGGGYYLCEDEYVKETNSITIPYSTVLFSNFKSNTNHSFTISLSSNEVFKYDYEDLNKEVMIYKGSVLDEVSVEQTDEGDIVFTFNDNYQASSLYQILDVIKLAHDSDYGNYGAYVDKEYIKLTDNKMVISYDFIEEHNLKANLEYTVYFNFWHELPNQVYLNKGSSKNDLIINSIIQDEGGNLIITTEDKYFINNVSEIVLDNIDYTQLSVRFYSEDMVRGTNTITIPYETIVKSQLVEGEYMIYYCYDGFGASLFSFKDHLLIIKGSELTGIPDFSVKQNDNGDIVIKSESQELMKHIDLVLYSNSSGTGFPHTSFIKNANELIIPYQAVKYSELKPDSTYEFSLHLDDDSLFLYDEGNAKEAFIQTGSILINSEYLDIENKDSVASIKFENEDYLKKLADGTYLLTYHTWLGVDKESTISKDSMIFDYTENKVYITAKFDDNRSYMFNLMDGENCLAYGNYLSRDYPTIDIVNVYSQLDMAVLKADAIDYLKNLYPGTDIKLNFYRGIVLNNEYIYSESDNDKYFKVYGLTLDNSILMSINLDVYFKTSTSAWEQIVQLPYDYPNKFITLEFTFSLDQMAKLGITKNNYLTQTVTVLREHNGKVDELAATVEPVTVNGTIISFKVKFKTDKMSLFSVANKNSVVRPSSGNPSASTKKPVVNTAAK